MPFPFTCPHCGTRTVVADQYAGQTGPCAKCGQPVTIPYLDVGASVRRGMSGGAIVAIALAVLGVGFVLAVVCGAVMIAMSVQPSPSRIRPEVSALDMAVKAFKEKFGDYPPDGTDPAEVKRFVTFAFPRYSGPMPDTGGPAKALAFWLGGLSANPEDPFDKSNIGIGPFFDFDPARLRNGMYYPSNSHGNTEPYVYFKAREDGTYIGEFRAPNGSLVKPCKDSRTGGFANRTSFQIRAPGPDGRHGSGVDFPQGLEYDKYQYDDMSNFSGGNFKGASLDARHSNPW